MTKDDFTLSFDLKIRTKTGYVAAVEIISDDSEEVATPALGSDQPVNVNEFHCLLGHVSEAKARAVAKYYGVKLVGKFETCSACAAAKARQMNIPKEIPEASKCKVVGEKLHFDISSIKARSFGGAKYWLLVLDEATGYIFSFFLRRKKDTAQTIIRLVKHLRSKGKHVKKIRCDNAGENKKTEELCLEHNLGIDFEYTAPNTPQQNGRVERRFATLYGRVRSMLNSAHLNESLRCGLWAECAQTATYLDNLDCENMGEQPRYKLFNGTDDKRFSYLRKFGEMAIVTTGNLIRNKLENRGVPAIYLGHAPQHSAQVSRFLKLSTRRVIRSRDARFLEKTFLQWARDTGYDLYQQEDMENEFDTASDDDSDENEDFLKHTNKLFSSGITFDDDFDEVYKGQIEKDKDENTMTNQQATESEVGRVTRSGRVFNQDNHRVVNLTNPRVQSEMRRLGTWFNPLPETVLENGNEANLNIDSPNALLGRENGQIVTEFQNLSMNTMDHLFGDFMFFARKTNMESVKMERKKIETQDIYVKLRNMHILDALDYLENEDGNNMPVQLRDELLRELILKLKSMLPKSYKEAWDHPDPKMRAQWRKAFQKELGSMEKQKVWKVIKKKDMPKGRRCVRSKWVFDIKRNGMFKVRLVACGYTQIPGVDFTDSFAPVITDVSWRILIIVMLVWNLDAMIIDVETAFLLGDLDEEIYMICRQVHNDDEVLFLQHSIYGLVQAARQYYKKFVSVLKKLGFKGGYPDPCLMTRQTTNGVVFIAIWVDDSLLVGNKEAIDEAIDDLKREGFTLKVEGSLHDYLSCEITIDKERKMGWIHQPHLLEKLEQKFGNDVKHLQRYRTPGTPGQTMLRNTESKVDDEKHRIYRSGVGMLLYLVKHSRPDIANAVRELTKALDAPSLAAYKEMLRDKVHP